MQGWLYSNELIYLGANISANQEPIDILTGSWVNKISVPGSARAMLKENTITLNLNFQTIHESLMIE